MKISEVFYSFQGEGQNIGKPAIFIRLWGCNRNCVWCDEQEKLYIEMFVNSVMVQIAELVKINSFCPPIIITGGEPMLQESPLFCLLGKIRDKFTTVIWLETNGDFFNLHISKLFSFVSLSPKLRNSGYPTKITSHHLRWVHYANHYEIKLVIMYKKDFEEVKKIRKLLNVPPYRIRLMKEKSGSEKLQQEIIKEALKEGYSVTPRLQDIWNIK